MGELLKRLLLSPVLLAELLILSLIVNLLALASPLFVMQVLQRYITSGVDSTLQTLVFGVLIAALFEFLFRNIRHRVARITFIRFDRLPFCATFLGKHRAVWLQFSGSRFADFDFGQLDGFALLLRLHNQNPILRSRHVW